MRSQWCLCRMTISYVAVTGQDCFHIKRTVTQSGQVHANVSNAALICTYSCDTLGARIILISEFEFYWLKIPLQCQGKTIYSRNSHCWLSGQHIMRVVKGMEMIKSLAARQPQGHWVDPTEVHWLLGPTHMWWRQDHSFYYGSRAIWSVFCTPLPTKPQNEVSGFQ